MSQLKYVYQDIQPVTLHIPEESTTSRLYSSMVEGVGGQVSGLVEMFLVEVYRCRVCQFTSSQKSKISAHVINRHELGRTCHPLTCLEKDEVGQQEEEELDRDSVYGMEDQLHPDGKDNDDHMDVGLERVSFLLPMYGMLHNISPQSCDMSLSTNSDGLHVAHTCEVTTLFEEGEEASQFRLEDPGSLSCPMGSAADCTSEDQDDEMAQSAHLMSLGLCRISSMKAQPMNPESGRAPEATDSQPPEKRAPSPLPGFQKNSDHQETLLCHNLDLASKTLLEVPQKDHEVAQGSRALPGDHSASEWRPTERPAQGQARECRAHLCEVCQRQFKSVKSRDHHQRRHGKELPVAQCAVCLALCSSEQEREQHIACHFQDTFKCIHCSFRDKSWKKVYKHLTSQHPPDEEVDKDPECDKGFSRIHQSTSNTRLATQSRPGCLKRLLCGEQFRSWPDGELHGEARKMKRKKKRKAQRSSQVQHGRGSAVQTEQERTSSNRRRRAGKEFPCSQCGRKFSSRLALRRHMGIHSGVKPFECEDCDYKTRLKASLIQHMRVHTGEKPFKCSQCSYASIDGSSLRRHSRIHTREKPHQCQLCPYSCIQKKSLDLHVRRHHTGEAFFCHLCPYSSPDKQLVHRHVKRHHSG
ncbi:ZN668 protein, partial [Amia calva]|nr:ZN668 protein [Amia calva]